MLKLFKTLPHQHSVNPHAHRRSRSRRSPLVLMLLIVLWSIILGWGLAQAADSPSDASQIGTVDVVTPQYELGQDLYLENCSSCHVGVPPAVLPTETWRQILEDPEHYGVQLPLLVDPPRLLVWNYLSQYSRPQKEGEPVPYRINDSSFFKALHPRVDLPQPSHLGSCVSCHPGAPDFNYRRLSPEWENSP